MDNRIIIKIPVFLLLFLSANFFSCQQSKPVYSRPAPSFEKVTGIKFTEVRRAFDTGLAFNEHGFQQEPEWILYFMSKDSVKIYSPFKHRYIHYKVYYDHDSVLNMAREWFRVKKVSADSLVLQLLRVEDKAISKEMSNVFMTFYSDNYLKNVLHANADSLKKPNRKDSLFIRSKAVRANRNPGNIDSAFAARQPVVLASASKILTVKKVNDLDDPVQRLEGNPSYSYLYPEYNITINPAYKDFDYSFSVLVDDKGVMRFGMANMAMMPEFAETKIKVMKGIMSVYLQNLLKITPGKTLGIPHTSLIKLNVVGRKNSG